MKWLLRPSLLIVASTAFVVGAVAVALRTGPALARPDPLPVAPADREIVWLYPATNAAAWERFVAAVRRAPEALRQDLPAVGAEVSPARAFPEHTTAVPEVALSLGPGGGRLVFRWYKLTSDWNTRDWVEALLRRAPPPLAVIGGSSSDAARELAFQLRQAGAALPEGDRPLLLLTTATADRVSDPAGNVPRPPPGPAAAGEEPDVTPGVPLNDLYPGRTFRFCFTNRQMAGAVTHFLWTQPDLRPDRAPVYMVRWDDDSYSRDLIEGFWKALERRAEQGQFRMDILPTPQVIDSSVGGFSRPNRFEAKVARDLLDLRQAQQGRQKRPLLVLTGQSAPSRRFVRALVRSGPDMARQFVVATGDAISFNHVYRDRGVAWNVLDLPVPLVFFCHHNPVDPGAGFRPLPGDRGGPPAGPPGAAGDPTASTGTEDMLLYGDIVEALAQAQRGAGRTGAGAAELAAAFGKLQVRDGHVGLGPDGAPLFNAEESGKRKGGTSEHIVSLRPHVQGGRVLPEATITVWARPGRPGQRPSEGEWRPVGQPLKVFYDHVPVEGGGRE